MKYHFTACRLISAFVLLHTVYTSSSQIKYGNNSRAGQYFNVGDAKIYYEVYGSGQPVVLLHGGLFGYIDDYADLIPVLSKKFQVIAIATRGHGKSELGSEKFSYKLFSEDSYKVIRHITKDSIILVGFSDGAEQAYYLAADHPEAVKKLVAIGGNFGISDYPSKSQAFMNNLDAGYFHKYQQGFMEERKKIMPDSARFDEFVNRLAAVWKDSVYVPKEKVSAIQCPALIVAGENDGCPIETYTKLYRLLRNGHFAIIPGSDHLVFIRQPKLTIGIITSFLGIN